MIFLYLWLECRFLHLLCCGICWNAEASAVLMLILHLTPFLYAKHMHSPLLFSVVSLPIPGVAKCVEQQLLISPTLPIR